LFTALCGFQALAQAPVTRVNPAIKQIVDQVSEERIGATMKRLGDFGTRYVASEQDSDTRGNRRRAALGFRGAIQELQP